MKRLFFGTLNAMLDQMSRMTGTYFNNINCNDESSRMYFVIYDNKKITYNNMKLIGRQAMIDFIDDLIDNHYIGKLSSWSHYNSDFNKNIQKLVKYCDEADAISYSFNSSESMAYHFRTIMVSILGPERIKYDYSIGRSYLYECRAITAGYESSSSVDEDMSKRFAKNLINTGKNILNKYIEDCDETFDSNQTESKLLSCHKNNLEAISYFYTYYNYAANVGLDEEIKDGRQYIDTFMKYTDKIINIYKTNVKDVKEQRKFINSLNLFELYYSYSFTNNDLTKYILDYNLNLLKHRGVNKQTLTSFFNYNLRLTNVLDDLEGITNIDIIEDKLETIIKRNETNLNNSVFRIAYKFFKDKINWSSLNVNNLREHFSDEELEEIGITVEKYKKYYRDIIDLLNEAKYPFNEFATVALMINELEEDDFKSILPLLTTALYKFIHKNLTANDSYRSKNYSYGRFFNMLRDKDGNYYNKKNVEILFRGLYDSSEKLNSSMKKKLTIFCMQCDLDGVTSDMKVVPKDYKTISMELKMKK